MKKFKGDKATGLTLLFLIIALHGIAQVPNWQWAKHAGGNWHDVGVSVAADANGNVVTTGYFESDSIIFGTITLINNGSPLSSDIFIVKYDQLGNVLWAKSAGGDLHDAGADVVTDANNNIIVTGSFDSDSITFDSFTLINSGNENIFIVKYDPLGNIIWAKAEGGNYAAAGIAVTTDASDNIILTGYFNSQSITFGTITLNHVWHEDVFVVKYDSAGTVQWAKAAGGDNADMVFSIETDFNGNIIILGAFSSTNLNFSPFLLTNTPSLFSNIFIAKYNSSGNVLWAQSLGGNESEYALDVTMDGFGNILAMGVFSSPNITFGNITLSNPLSPSEITFIVKYDSTGNDIWAESFNDNISGWRIKSGLAGNFIVTGMYTDSATFGSSTLYSTGWLDIYVAEYDSICNAIWGKSAGGNSTDWAWGITSYGASSIYIAGLFTSQQCSFGTTTFLNSGSNSNDFFIAKLDTGTFTTITAYDVEKGFNMFPNPSTGYVTFEFSSQVSNGVVEIYNQMGEEIFNDIIYSATKKEIYFDNISAGIYFVRVFDGDRSYNKKLIIEPN